MQQKLPSQRNNWIDGYPFIKMHFNCKNYVAQNIRNVQKCKRKSAHGNSSLSYEIYLFLVKFCDLLIDLRFINYIFLK